MTNSIKLTSDAERERVANAHRLRKSKWELLKTFSLVEAVRYARDNGWKEKKVQVRREGEEFFVEPFERDCRCPHILKYSDYFD